MQTSTKNAINALVANKARLSTKPVPPNDTEYLTPETINALILGAQEIVVDVEKRARFSLFNALADADAALWDVVWIVTEATLYISDGVNWNPITGGSINPLKITSFTLKANSVTASGCVLQFTYDQDGANVPTIKLYKSTDGGANWDAGTDITATKIQNGSVWECTITGETQGTHTYRLNESDINHGSGVNSGNLNIAYTLPVGTIAASGVVATQMTVDGTINNLATQATVQKVRVAYALQGTDANADAAVAAGRYFDITAGADITAFLGAGYTKTGLALVAESYIPSVQIFQVCGDGVTVQNGGWTAGAQFGVWPYAVPDNYVSPNAAGFKFRKSGTFATGTELSAGEFRLHSIDTTQTRANQPAGASCLVKDKSAGVYTLDFTGKTPNPNLYSDWAAGPYATATPLVTICDTTMPVEISTTTAQLGYRKLYIAANQFGDGHKELQILYWDTNANIYYWNGSAWSTTVGYAVSFTGDFKVNVVRNADNSYTVTVKNAANDAVLVSCTTPTSVKFPTGNDRIILGDFIESIDGAGYYNQNCDQVISAITLA